MEYSADKVNYIVSEYIKGRTQKEIALELNTYNTTIRRILKRKNIPIRGGKEVQPIVKTNPFINLADEETLYWLGYIAGDGNISKDPRNRVNISTNVDPEHLKKYIKFLGYDLKLYKYLNKKYNCYEYSVNFANTEVKKYLVDLGITPNKSLTLKVDNRLLTFPFFRGYFDANGTITKYSDTYSRFSIVTGSKCFATQLHLFLNDNNTHSCIKVITKNKKNPVYRVTIGKVEEVSKLIYKLYNNASVYLDRKKQNIGLSLWKHSAEISS